MAKQLEGDFFQELLWRWFDVSRAQCTVCDGGYEIWFSPDIVYFLSELGGASLSPEFTARLDFFVRKWIEELRWNWAIKKTRKGYRCILRRGHLRHVNTIHAFHSSNASIALLSAYVQLLELLREDNYGVS